MRIDRQLERCKRVVALRPRRRLFRQPVRIENRALVDRAIRNRLRRDARYRFDDVDFRIKKPAVMQTEIEHREQQAGEAEQVGEQDAPPQALADGARNPPARNQPARAAQRRLDDLACVEARLSIGRGRRRRTRAGNRRAYSYVIAVERHPIPIDGGVPTIL